MKKRPASLLLVTVALLLFGTGQALADTIVYTVQSTASGTLGASTFTNASVVFSFTGATANVTNPLPGLFENTIGTGTITVGGVGLATFTDSVLVFANQSVPGVGIFDGTTAVNMLDTLNPVFGSYNLTSAVGPVSGTSATNLGFDFLTTLGALNFSAMSNSSTFTSTTTTNTVPEPATLWLLGAGAMFLLRRRK